jgi:hypothetical protein
MTNLLVVAVEHLYNDSPVNVVLTLLGVAVHTLEQLLDSIAA